MSGGRGLLGLPVGTAPTRPLSLERLPGGGGSARCLVLQLLRKWDVDFESACLCYLSSLLALLGLPLERGFRQLR